MEQPFFIGSFTVPSPLSGAPDGHGAGIVRAVLETTTGEMHATGAIESLSPAFLCGVLEGRVWAVAEAGVPGTVTSFTLDGSAPGGLSRTAVAETGALWPCHVEVDLTRRIAYVSHFHGGTLSTVALDSDGRPTGPVEVLEPPRSTGAIERPGATHPHCVCRIDDDHLVVADCGRDFVLLYRVHGTAGAARLELAAVLPLPVGSGPRHIALDIERRVLYVSMQWNPGVAVIAIEKGEGGTGPRLRQVQAVGSPGVGRAQSFPSEIVVHPNGGRVYMANRRDESISVYEVIHESGLLRLRATLDAHGMWPRHFRLSPDGRCLVVANQNSNEAVAFLVDQAGDLEWSGQRLAVATPTCIAYAA